VVGTNNRGALSRREGICCFGINDNQPKRRFHLVNVHKLVSHMNPSFMTNCMLSERTLRLSCARFRHWISGDRACLAFQTPPGTSKLRVRGMTTDCPPLVLHIHPRFMTNCMLSERTLHLSCAHFRYWISGDRASLTFQTPPGTSELRVRGMTMGCPPLVLHIHPRFMTNCMLSEHTSRLSCARICYCIGGDVLALRSNHPRILANGESGE